MESIGDNIGTHRPNSARRVKDNEAVWSRCNDLLFVSSSRPITDHITLLLL